MSEPVAPSQRRATGGRPLLAVTAACLAVLGTAGGTVTAAAPAAARPWVLWTAVAGGLIALVAVVVATLSARRARAASAEAAERADALRHQAGRQAAHTAQLVNVTLPAVAERLRGGASAEQALTGTPMPDDAHLARVLDAFARELASCVRQRRVAEAEREAAERRAAHLADEAERLTTAVLPAAFGRLHDGASADTVLAALPRPQEERLAGLLDYVVRQYATSERRSAAAQAASAKALSRVQAAAVSMLADLREMQERHGEELLGDLLRLDHSTSQLGLLADRVALLMGGRASRSWNKPIVMENILRGAMGRIAAYRRVRPHCASTAAIAGFAAEGVIHLLAELIDNAANFSPPTDDVNVYVEERTAGIVVTIEDSGVRMADAAMRRAEKAVAGELTDLADLQGTRLGLAVVGRLAVKYGISVSYRPSSRGGTGVVVLLPPHLLAQQRAEPHARAAAPESPARKKLPAPAAERALPEARTRTETGAGAGRTETEKTETERTEAEAESEAGTRAAGRTPHGLPVRPRGRTLAQADRGRERAADTAEGKRPVRDTGARFGAFHRSRRPENPSS
ncbi:MAG TPA: ATP-binding protein [Streptomyces sp.]|uniref:sensor histidine kinase n=1 Tax=Streptomyces sp. TaxID=1931 RepID=UPI002D2A9D03|nr:ATP-binding protein [Streptomyces sp.]HZG05633.1 ATP-binding protein [Streptomyces sp.]